MPLAKNILTISNVRYIIIDVTNVGYIGEILMIKALILYYLNIKPTHGYDIQRFIELNGIDKWSKIQSGSIYYALDKLEKDGFIYVLREERTGARIRKIYAINDSGREELTKLLKEELLKPIAGVESDKFMVYCLINKLSKEDITSCVEKHIKTLKEKKTWWEHGKNIKINQESLKVEELNFDMVISSLDYQIRWHEALLEQIDEVIKAANAQEKLIGTIDFSSLNDVEYEDIACKDYYKVEQLKNDFIKNPNNQNLDNVFNELIKIIKNNKK